MGTSNFLKLTGFFKSLAYKLMRASLAIAVLLGVIGGLVQVSMDFVEQQDAIDSRIQDIFRVTGNTAQHAVHLLDNRMADEVIKGIAHYDFILQAIIYDDSGRVMANYEKPSAPSSTGWLTQLVSDETRQYRRNIVYVDGSLEGRFVITVDNDLALAPFYNRVLTIFISGFVRNIGLAFVLLILYHVLLTRPLIAIAQQVSRIDPRKAEGRRVAYLEKHRDDELGAIISAVNDVLITLEGEQADLRQRGKQLSLILNSSPSLIYALNAVGDFVFLNQAAANFYGQSVNGLIGLNSYQRLKMISPDEADKFLALLKKAEVRREQLFEDGQSMTDHTGVRHIMQVSYIPFDFYDQLCVLVVAHDITGRVAAEKRVESLAYFDSLTGLPNRNMLYDRVKMDISRCRRAGTYGALLFIDLDEFKRVNDSLGHSAGDELLLQLSKSMSGHSRQTDTLARLGGDEFTLSMPDLSPDFDVAQEQAAECAGRLLVTLSQPVFLGGHELIVSASIGIVLYPQGNEDTETLLRFADTAMYKAKQSGRNAYMIFEQSMAVEADQLVKLEAELRVAARERQFTFHLQPLIDVQGGRVAGAEALMRWQHPEKGLIPPGAFLDFLESSGMIAEVDRQIFKDVCVYAAEHYRKGRLPKGFRFSINLSAKELHRAIFVDDVKSTLEISGLPAHFIEFEITESAALQNLEDVVQKMHVLQSLGITFALDDFGTGYSSLSYLKQLPVDKVKIDKTFINDLTFDRQDEALVESIVAIANTFQLVVVAEGVETAAQADWFKQYKNVYYQGYLFDRPLPPQEYSDKYLATPVSGRQGSVVRLRPN